MQHEHEFCVLHVIMTHSVANWYVTGPVNEHNMKTSPNCPCTFGEHITFKDMPQILSIAKKPKLTPFHTFRPSPQHLLHCIDTHKLNE